MKKEFLIGAGIGVLMAIMFGLGFAHGKKYWSKRYDWIISDLHKDIDGCRSVLNDPHHCVSYVVDNLDKICGDCYAE